MASPKFHNSIRQYHRWLGFFLAGVMGVYAISGILLIFRSDGYFKVESFYERQLSKNLNARELGEELDIRKFRITNTTDETIVFRQGSYDRATGIATYTIKDYPFPLDKMVHLHKATTNSPLYILNIVFGFTLLFFVISAFLMFIPKIKLYKNGLKIASFGFLFTFLIVIFGNY